MKLLKKITTKLVGFGKSELQAIVFATKEVEGKPVRLLENGSEVALYKIAGVISDVRPGNTDLGPFAKFIGEFKVVTREGEEFYSGVAILPSALEGALQGQAMGCRNESQSLEFAAEITVQRDDASATGYVFGSYPLMEYKPSDRLGAVMLASGIGTAPALENGAGAPPAAGAAATPIASGRRRA